LLDTIAGALGRMASAGRAKAAPVGATLAAMQRSLNVLLAEDNVVNQKLAILLLQRRGHTVTLATNGKEALAELRKRDFDLCLMDVQMPELDGLETTAAIRANEKGTSRHLPIVAMTAHAIKGDREICLAAGMDAYLSKPVRADELFRTIEGLLPEKATVASGGATGQRGTPAVAFDEAEFLARMDGSYDVCAQIAEAFFSEGPRLIGRLKEELKKKDAPQVTRTAHALKGAIANFTDGVAFQSAVRLEQLAREGDLRLAGENLPRLESEVAALLEELRSFVGAAQKV
jgi:two-component system, sensor histidine kinase and response regulator